MHELRIAELVMEIALGEIERRHLTGVSAVGVRVGALSGVNPPALEFSYEALIPGTALEGTKLKIEEIPVKGNCNACKKDFEVDEFIFVCPHCYSTNILITQGEELDVAYLETE